MIAILLSAYNGADYIGKQIDSLLSQTYQDFTISLIPQHILLEINLKY